MTSPSIAARPVRLVFTAVTWSIPVFGLWTVTTSRFHSTRRLRCNYDEQCGCNCYRPPATQRVVSTFYCKFGYLAGFPDVSRRPMIIHHSPPPRRPLRGPASARAWSRFAERRRCWLLAGAAWHAQQEPPEDTPPPRSRKTSRKEQEFDPARVSGEHTTGNKWAAAAPSVSTSAREQLHSSSAAPTAKQAKNKPCSSRSAPRRSRPWPRPAPPSRCDA